jgi:SAM-dependent methyltransferase
LSDLSDGGVTDEQALAFVSYFNHLLRDWSAEPAAVAENAQALRLVVDTLGEESAPEARPWGRTLVLGAGACRLTYDLVRRYRPTMTVALDVSPLLLLAAQQILFGPGLRLYEIPESPEGLSSVCVERELRAPEGAPTDLYLVLGDALAAPFRPGTFDTVVTPWFVDIVGGDVPDTLAVIHRMLAPGGRWISIGPLLYPAGRPAMRRYTPEEILDLGHRAGLGVSSQRVERVDLLRSSASTRHRSERVVVSVATKVDPPRTAPDGVPPWLLFSHVPIPRFLGLDGTPDEPILAYVAGLIDGNTTLRDIADRMIADHGARPDAALEGTRALVTALYQNYQVRATDIEAAAESAFPA